VNMDGLSVLRLILARHGLGDDRVPAVIHALIRFGGHEGSELTPEMVMAALTDQPTADWKSVAWCCREILQYYVTSEHENLENLENLGLVIVVVILAKTIRMGFGFGYELGEVMGGLYASRWFLLDEDIVDILRFITSELERPDSTKAQLDG
jgi:hypothetical protein